MQLQSSAFLHNHTIPSDYTCDGMGISPPLAWSDVPQNTQSLVLICDDPDAPSKTWVHWVIYNIPVSVHSLDKNLQTLPPGAISGINSWNKEGYGGPCTPSGTHRYFFKLYALDILLPTHQPMNKEMLEKAIKGHKIDQAELIGLYRRTSI